MSIFQEELEGLINKYSQENGSDTPDFILAEYLTRCLAAFNHAINDREDWYGRSGGELPKAPEEGSTSPQPSEHSTSQRASKENPKEGSKQV